MNITIYQRNIWPEIVAEQHPRYMALRDFTISLEIEDGPAADALEKDPLLHQELIDKINAFVNEKTSRLLGKYVYRHESKIAICINNRNFEGLTIEYREFDVFFRYLLAVTNDNLKQLISTTIRSRVRDAGDVTKYIAKIVIKLVFNVAGIAVSTTLLAIGTGSAIATSGVTAIPGLIVGLVFLCQSFAELAREIYKAVESLKMAGVDAIESLKQLEKRYKGSGSATVGAKEVLLGGVNKVFSGYVELNTITTLASKFELWGNKILIVDQKSHDLAKKFPELFRKIEEVQRSIMFSERPPVPSRDGCKLRVPPQIPSRDGRPSIHPPKPKPPELPSRAGRVSGIALRETLGLKTPPPIPSTIGSPALPPKVVPNVPPPTKATDRFDGNARSTNARQLSQLRDKVNATIIKTADLQKEVKIHKLLQEQYKGALDKLKGSKPQAALVVEMITNTTVSIAKAGISLGLGGYDLSNGAKTVTDTISSVSQLVVAEVFDATSLSIDLVENFGDLGSALHEKNQINHPRP